MEGWRTHGGLEDTWRGMPCFENTWEMNASAMSGAVLVSVVGMKRHYLDALPITTRIGETIKRG